MAKLRGTEAEIHARLRELTERLRQIRKELIDASSRRPEIVKDAAGDRTRPPAGKAQSPNRKPE